MPDWDSSVLSGPEGEDWRVPVSELEQRLNALADALQASSLPGVLIQHPIDLYYFAGGRQDGTMFVPAQGAGGSAQAGGDGPVFYVRRSLQRAQHEAGGENAPFIIEPFPRLRLLSETLQSRGVTDAPALQFGELPTTFANRFSNALSSLGTCADATSVIHRLREVKSAWEQEQMEATILLNYTTT